MSGKRQLCYVVPPMKLSKDISSIFSPKIKLGPNLHPSTTKMAVARLRCDGDSLEVFHGQIGSNQQQKCGWHDWGVMEKVWKCCISFILTYKVRKNTALLCCTVNQVGTGHKLHFQPKHPSWAILAAINNKNGCGTAEIWIRQFKSISYHW